MAITFGDDQGAKLLESLGLPPETTDVDLILATVADLAAQAAELDPARPSTVAAAAKKAGLEVVDTATLESLRRDAGEGRRMAAEAARAKVEQQVDDAVRRGKVAASRRKHWEKLISADPGMSQVLASVPDNTIPVAEVGQSMNPEPGDELAEPVWFR